MSAPSRYPAALHQTLGVLEMVVHVGERMTPSSSAPSPSTGTPWSYSELTGYRPSVGLRLVAQLEHLGSIVVVFICFFML